MVKLNFSKIKKLKTPYPIITMNKFLDLRICKKICREINDFNNYDDLVMNGRFRVNKGSDHFDQQLKQSPNLKSLYNQLNNLKFYKKISKQLNYEISNRINNFYPELNNPSFSKNKFGRQSFKLLSHLRETKFISKLFRQTLNLDMDFSKSKKGYFRVAHRDRDTRVISFLIYLNSFKNKDGGQLEIYETKKNFYTNDKFPRFPEKKAVKKIISFPPKAGQLVVFMSTPDSYHGVSKFKSIKKDRVFIYGSYSMDRKVTWRINA